MRAADVEPLLGEVHPAYEYLSLVHRSDYLRCELLHRYGGLYADLDTLCWSALAELHADRGELDRAQSAFARALEADPGDGATAVACGLRKGSRAAREMSSCAPREP